MKIPKSDQKIFDRRAPLLSPLSLFLIFLILMMFLFLPFKTQIQASFAPTPYPTRNAASHVSEANTLFEAGNLEASITAYQEALAVDSENIDSLIQLARLQVYYSILLPFDQQVVLLADAQRNVDLAVSLDDFNSNSHAIKALVYDWNASVVFHDEQNASFLGVAAKAAERAVLLDNTNALAVAFRAEILADQFRYTQARQQAELAVSLDPNSMDAHRIYAYILEATGNYSKAIDEYKKAAEILPRMTFLYIKIGQNYRQLNLFDKALEYFDLAATINGELGIEDPLPFVAIAKTYSRDGEFFVAAINMEKALRFDPTNALIYGELGLIRFKARNYEGSIDLLGCAVNGCETVLDPFEGPVLASTLDEDELAGQTVYQVESIGLKNSTVVFYYTYGSVLAALDYCPRAKEVLDVVAEAFADDEIIMDIVESNELICEILGGEN
jgi:tetratricopeptide (TPR) repeat protein